MAKDEKQKAKRAINRIKFQLPKIDGLCDSLCCKISSQKGFMATIEQQISTQEIMNAAKQMSLTELENLVERMIALQAERRAPHLKAKETMLLERINKGLPIEEKTRLHELIAKRDDETITQGELEELIGLTDRLEGIHADRVAALVELAQVCGTTLDALMQQLGIRFPDHD